MKKLYKKLIIFGIALMMIVGSIYIGTGDYKVFATVENIPTIHMGDNSPMTRDEFMEWRSQKGFRYIGIEGSILPAIIFFNWYNGQSFDCGEIRNEILYVFLRPGVSSESRSVFVQEISNENEVYQDGSNFSPFLFDCLTPILFSDDELTAIIESVPHQNPFDTRSAITFPNRRLTESEIATWIAEYNEMGGATTFEFAVVREINRVREQYGLRPLALDPSLMMSTRFKTQEFGDLQYYAHASPVHGSPSETARLFGFSGSGVSETITRSGSSSAPVFDTAPEGIVGGMLASSRGHKEILLNPNAYSVGFGSFFSPNSTGRDGNMSHMFYYATMFGFYDR
jgi:uncharacterized protein YkwD